MGKTRKKGTKQKGPLGEVSTLGTLDKLDITRDSSLSTLELAIRWLGWLPVSAGATVPKAYLNGAPFLACCYN